LDSRRRARGIGDNGRTRKGGKGEGFGARETSICCEGGSKGRIETYNERPEAEEGEEGAEAEGKPA